MIIDLSRSHCCMWYCICLKSTNGRDSFVIVILLKHFLIFFYLIDAKAGLIFFIITVVISEICSSKMDVGIKCTLKIIIPCYFCIKEVTFIGATFLAFGIKRIYSTCASRWLKLSIFLFLFVLLSNSIHPINWFSVRVEKNVVHVGKKTGVARIDTGPAATSLVFCNLHTILRPLQ